MNRSEVQDYLLDAYARATETQKEKLGALLSPISQMPSPSDEIVALAVEETKKIMKEK